MPLSGSADYWENSDCQDMLAENNMLTAENESLKKENERLKEKLSEYEEHL